LALAILIVSAALKVLYIEWRAGGAFSQLTYPDEWNYYLPAAAAIREQGFAFFFEPRSLWTGPINPLWIALLGLDPTIVKLANIGLWMATGILVFDMARRLFDSTSGLIAVALYSASIPLFNFVPTLLTEPPFLALFVLWLWMAILGSSWQPRGYHVLAGVVMGLATLVRPTIQLLPFFLAFVVGVMWLLGRKSPKASPALTRLFKQVMLMLAGSLVVLVPYLVKNVIALDQPTIANGSGAVLYLGNDLRRYGDEPIYTEMVFDTFELTSPYTHLDSEGDDLLTAAALDEIRQHPVDVAKLQIAKAVRLVFGSAEHYFWPYDDVVSYVRAVRWSSLFNVWDLVSTVAIAAFSIVGAIKLDLPSGPRTYLVGSAVYLALVHTILFPIPRMLLPAIPILVILAAGALARFDRREIGAVGLAAAGIISLIAFHGRLFPEIGVTERYVGYFDEVAYNGTGTPIAVNDLVADDGGWTVTGSDPYVVLDLPDFPARVNQVIFIEIASQHPTNNTESRAATVRWSSTGQQFTDDRSASFDLRIGSDAIHVISPSFGKPWEGEISSLRVDLPGDVLGARYEIPELTVAR
jgi:hypothetical protein